MRVGLTGGIASGKSTVSALFEKLGVPVIDADLAARRVVELGSEGLNEVARRFGPGILRSDGSLDRAALREVVFQDAAARLDLEAILHPRIRADMETTAASVDYPYLIMSIPLLIEGGDTHSRVDRVLVVDICEDTQMERLLQRDGCQRSQAQAILASQASRSARLAAADDVLDNSGGVAGLTAAVDALHTRYLQMAA